MFSFKQSCFKSTSLLNCLLGSITLSRARVGEYVSNYEQATPQLQEHMIFQLNLVIYIPGHIKVIASRLRSQSLDRWRIYNTKYKCRTKLEVGRGVLESCLSFVKY